MSETLAQNRYFCKRYAANFIFGHVLDMAKRRKAPKTTLQTVFLKRVQEEMVRQKISRNALAKRVGAPRQRTLNDVMNGADPRLETVFQIATALGIPAWQLMTESASQTSNVTNFPLSSPLGLSDNIPSHKANDKRKRRV